MIYLTPQWGRSLNLLFLKGGFHMKKVLAVIFSLFFFAALSFAVVGCKKAEEPKPAPKAETAPAPAPAPAPAAPEAPAAK